jgi:hypothetical protein
VCVCVCVCVCILDNCNELVILTDLSYLEPIMMPLAKYHPNIGSTIRSCCYKGICEWVICLEIIRSVEMLQVRGYAMYIWVKFLAQHYLRSVKLSHLPECMMEVFS